MKYKNIYENRENLILEMKLHIDLFIDIRQLETRKLTSDGQIEYYS